MLALRGATFVYVVWFRPDGDQPTYDSLRHSPGADGHPLVGTPDPIPLHHSRRAVTSHANTFSRVMVVFIRFDICNSYVYLRLILASKPQPSAFWTQCCAKVLRPYLEPCRLMNENVDAIPARVDMR
jgi:hypothetical protein